MKNTVYKITYKYKIKNTKTIMTAVLNLNWDGFPEMLDIEKEIKANLKKWNRFILLKIEDVEKIVT